MRADSQRLHASLLQAAKEVEAGRASGEAVSLLALGRLLFGPPLAQITQSVRDRLFRSKLDVELELAKRMSAPLATQAQTIGENLGAVQVSALASQDLVAARRTAEQLRSDLAAGKLGGDQISAANELARLTVVVGANQPTPPNVVQATLQLSNALKADVASAQGMASEWGAIGRELDVSKALDEFEAFYRSCFDILEGRELPAATPPRADVLSRYAGPILQLARAVMVELVLRPTLHASVMRLRVHLETFRRLELLDQMKAIKGQTGASKYQNEEVLQKATDAFLFLEGIFPLTHFEVAGGNVDTAFEHRRAAAVEETTALASVPALIELKQVVKFEKGPPSATELAAAVDAAVKQVILYRGNLVSKWPDLTAYVVVGYDGAKRYFLNPPNDRVVLVYLGETSPSEKNKEPLEYQAPEAF